MPVPLDSLGFLGIILNLKINNTAAKIQTFYELCKFFKKKRSKTCPPDSRRHGFDIERQVFTIARQPEILFRFLLQQVYYVWRKLHCKQYFCKSSAFFLISTISHRVFFRFRLMIASKTLKNLHVSELFLIFAAKL